MGLNLLGDWIINFVGNYLKNRVEFYLILLLVIHQTNINYFLFFYGICIRIDQLIFFILSARKEEEQPFKPCK